jgi:multiple antibiotic resistance protein
MISDSTGGSMSTAFPIDSYIKSFIALFVVMDALGNAPIFISLTQKLHKKESLSRLNTAILVAGGVIALFLILGKAVLLYFGISVGDFQVAGGIIFFLLGIEMVFGLNFLSARVERYDIAIVPLATPLIAGPGVLTTIIIITNTYGYLPAIVASVTNLILTRIILGNSLWISRFTGKQGAEILTRIMGILLTALAISFIRTGITNG